MNLDRIEQQAGHLPAYQIADSVNEALMESAFSDVRTEW